MADPVVDPVASVVPKPPPVSETAHILADLHKEKLARKELEDKLAAHEADKLKANNQYKELSELNAAKVKDLEAKLTAKDTAIVEGAKYNALKEAALKAGLVQVQDLDYVDLKGIQIETTSTGKVNVLGAEQAIENLKLQRPHWFASKTPPGISLNQPGVVNTPTGTVTSADLFKLEKDAKASGDYKAYHAAVMQMKNQR